MNEFQDKELEEILGKLRAFEAPPSSVIRAKNVVMYAVKSGSSLRKVAIERSKYRLIPIFNLRPKYMPLIALILAAVLGGGGTVAAAQNDLPGQSLYGVKLASERVAEALTVSDESKININVKFAERRTQEIAALKARAAKKAEMARSSSTEAPAAADATKEDVFSEQMEQAANLLQARIARLGERIEALKAKDSEATLKAAATLEAKAELWSEMLEAVRAAEDRADLKAKLQEVHGEARKLRDNALDAQESALKKQASAKGFEQSARNRVAAAEQKLKVLTERRAQILERAQDEKKEFSQEEFDERDKFYQEAVQLVLEAQSALEAGDFEGAWVKANAAFKAMVHFNRPALDPRLFKPVRPEDVTIQEGLDKDMSEAAPAPAALSETERAELRLEALQGASATPKLFGGVVVSLDSLRALAESQRKQAEMIAMQYKPQLGPVVREKIYLLAQRGQSAMDTKAYGEAARFFSQIIALVKTAIINLDSAEADGVISAPPPETIVVPQPLPAEDEAMEGVVSE